MYQYDDVFYQYINSGSAASARQLLPELIAVLPEPVHTVLDVGCGAGAWLSIWKTLGASVTGLDGGYIDKDQLLIDENEFIAADLKSGFSLGKQYSLVQSLEVAEHLPQESAATLVASLCAHSNLVLFSAATPGQGGENHINEQPHAYWRDLFKAHGFAMYDPVRAAVRDNREVMPWYRYNTFLYVSSSSPAVMLEKLQPYLVAADADARDLSPPAYRLRRQLVRLLPRRLSTLIAVAKKKLFTLSLRLKRAE